MITALGINSEDATAGDNKIIARKIVENRKNEEKSRTMEERRL